jgi:hypothetical protein
MRRETRTEELKANRQVLLMTLVKTKVNATWIMCAALCILLVTMPSTFAIHEEHMYHHSLICAWFTTVGTVCTNIKGGRQFQHQECIRECGD